MDIGTPVLLWALAVARRISSISGVTPAHNGVLFLGESPELPRNVLELLRQPIEDGAATLASSQLMLTFPARFMLVAAMNSCPYG